MATNDITLREVRDSLVQNNKQIVDEQFETRQAINTLIKRFGDMLDITKNNRLDDLEKSREAKADEKGEEKPSPAGNIGNTLDFQFADRILAGAALGLGTVLAYLDMETHKFVETVREQFVDFVNNLQKIGFVLKQGVFIPIADKIADFTKVVANTGLGKATTAFFKGFSSVFGVITGVLNKGLLLASGGLTTLLPNLEFLKGIGRIFSRLFLPLTLFITAWDTAKGAIDGFKEEGVVGAIQGAIEGLWNSLVSAPLDLLRSAAAWVLDRMGFDAAADVLQSFSFEGLFSSQLDTIFDGFKAIAGYVGDIFKGEFSLEKAKALLGELFNVSPLGMIKSMIEYFVPDLLARIQEGLTVPVDAIKTLFSSLGSNIVTKFNDALDQTKELGSQVVNIVPDMFNSIKGVFQQIVEGIAVHAEIMLKKITTVIANVPDRLLQFLSENVRISVPRMAIPLPFTDKELVITEGSEIGVPGYDEAAKRIAQRNAQLEAYVDEATLRMRRTPNIDARLVELGNSHLADTKATNQSIMVDNSTVAPSSTSVTNRMDSPVPVATDERMTL